MSEDEAPRHARFLHGVPRPSLSIGRTGSVLAVVLLLGAALSITSDNFLVTGNLLDVGAPVELACSNGHRGDGRADLRADRTSQSRRSSRLPVSSARW